MNVSEIVDGKSLEAWLNSLPQDTEAEKAEAQRWAVQIAHRAAMRVLPVFWQWSLTETARNVDLTAIPVLWPNLISGVAGTRPTPLIRVAARSTAAAARSAIQADCAALNKGQDLNILPLWPAKNPLADLWDETRIDVLAQGSDWKFWLDWYDNALRGAPQDWDLLTEIALIDASEWTKFEENWIKNADHVNALIQRVVTKHKAETPKFNEAIRSHVQLVLAIPEPSRQSADFLRVEFEKMEQAYRVAVGGPNETPEELEPIVTLARTFGQIADLLKNETDKDKLITGLQAKIEILEAQNSALSLAAHGSQASTLKPILIATAGGVGAQIVISFAQLGGPAVAEGAAALWNMITLPPGPSIDLAPSLI